MYLMSNTLNKNSRPCWTCHATPERNINSTARACCHSLHPTVRVKPSISLTCSGNSKRIKSVLCTPDASPRTACERRLSNESHLPDSRTNLGVLSHVFQTHQDKEINNDVNREKEKYQILAPQYVLQQGSVCWTTTFWQRVG